MAVQFRCESLLSRFQNPSDEAHSERNLQVRFDPLLGTSSRIAEGVKLQTRTAGAHSAFQAPDPNCPFCADRIHKLTPRFAREITLAGRIQVGDTVVFPNLVPYSKYAAVAVFTTRHWLDVREFPPALIADNLTASLEYIRAVSAADPDARFCAYNINYLYPSGGSLPHPHSQIFLDPYPTSMMRMQQSSVAAYRQENGSCFWSDLVSEETKRAERFICRDGPIVWITPFAPIGFNEVRAVLCERPTLLDLSPPDVEGLASGISRVLAWYHSIGYDSFNLTIYSGELGKDGADRVNLAMITRTAMVPFYRSDSMYLERLHWESALDRTPEDVAADLRKYLSSTNAASALSKS
jgi:UDPglucose--hexose-1-phosphate uridylyltransferase